jgi:hypothetical protein
MIAKVYIFGKLSTLVIQKCSSNQDRVYPEDNIFSQLTDISK